MDKIYIEVSRGMVSRVLSSDPDLAIEVLDRDEMEVDEELRCWAAAQYKEIERGLDDGVLFDVL